MKANTFINLFGLMCLLACCSPKEVSDQTRPMTPQEREEALINRNREFLRHEREQINQYVDSTGLEFAQTGSGLYYTILERSNESKSIVKGDYVELEYQMETIGGSALESSAESGNKKFTLLQDNEIVALHEGIALMHLNDEFLFIVPAHLGYGLGNQSSAPLNATLIYKVKIVSVN